MKLTQPQSKSNHTLLITVLPGSDRKRLPAPYQFRVTYRGKPSTKPGCVMTWEVTGGRLPYQVALEQLADGSRRWHCSCADAVYRGEVDAKHQCKHVAGLMESLQSVAVPVHHSESEA